MSRKKTQKTVRFICSSCLGINLNRISPVEEDCLTDYCPSQTSTKSAWLLENADVDETADVGYKYLTATSRQPWTKSYNENL